MENVFASMRVFEPDQKTLKTVLHEVSGKKSLTVQEDHRGCRIVTLVNTEALSRISLDKGGVK